MRYSASEKFEIIELVEQSSLSIPRTLAPIGIPRSTFYDWYSRYQEGGIEALEDGKPRPRRIWNKISDKIETAIVNLALEEPDLSPRELAVNFTDTKGSFVSEATVYRLLKDHGLITSPAFILMKAADRFANPTTAPNQLWQTDFTYLKVIGWGWFYLSTVLDDFSRYRLEAVHDDESRGCHRYPRSGAAGLRFARSQAHATAAALVRQRVQLHRGRSRQVARRPQDQAPARRPLSSNDPGQDRALAPASQKPHPAGKLLPTRRSRNPNRGLRRRLQPPPLPREHRQSHPGRRLLRTRPNHPGRTRKDQATDHC